LGRLLADSQELTLIFENFGLFRAKKRWARNNP